MKHILAIVLLTLVLSVLAHGQSQNQAPTTDPQTDEQRAAKEELNKAARAYASGNFAEAQRLSEKALQLDPANKNAPSFIARSTHAQYRPGVDSPENIALARQAIASYEKLLLMHPDDDEAFKAIAALYGAIGEDELQYSWILNRATNGAVSAEKRAEAYVILASKDWNCSYSISETPDNKQFAEATNGDGIIVYRAPKDRTEFDKARRCVTRGLDMAEAAILLNSENEGAWSFKANLLLEAAKLAEMDGNKKSSDEYNQLATEAQARTTELTDKQQKEPSDAEPENRDAVAPENAGVTYGTVVEGKAVSKPIPVYPDDAIAARAGGTVVVEIVIDEKGYVIEAKAVSGDQRLRAAAEKAALQSRFTPTLLSGQPVKVTGVIKYNFALN